MDTSEESTIRMRGSTGARAAMVLAVGAFLLGCTEFESGDDELSPMTSSEPLGGSLPAPANLLPDSDNEWSCIGTEPQRGLDPGDTGTPILYGLRVIDISTRTPVPGLNSRACNLTDPQCSAPVTAWLMADAEGWFAVPLTTTFSGYLEILGPMAIPHTFFLTERLQTARDYPLLLTSRQAFTGLTEALGLQDAGKLGSIATRVFDCRGEPAAGVTLTLSTPGVPYYFANGLPDTTRSETDADGIAGFLELASGVALMQAKLADGRLITQRSFVVRPGWLTTMYLRPAPLEGAANDQP